MRTINRIKKFKKDFKRESKGQHRAALDELLVAAVSLLAADAALPEAMRGHPLSGEWKDHRGFQSKPEPVLIY